MMIAYESGHYQDLVTALIGCVSCGEFRKPHAVDGRVLMRS